MSQGSLEIYLGIYHKHTQTFEIVKPSLLNFIMDIFHGHRDYFFTLKRTFVLAHGIHGVPIDACFKHPVISKKL